MKDATPFDNSNHVIYPFIIPWTDSISGPAMFDYGGVNTYNIYVQDTYMWHPLFLLREFQCWFIKTISVGKKIHPKINILGMFHQHLEDIPRK